MSMLRRGLEPLPGESLCAEMCVCIGAVLNSEVITERPLNFNSTIEFQSNLNQKTKNCRKFKPEY